MRITYFTDTFLPKIDGVSTSLVTITSALASIGHEILIFAPRPKNLREIKWKTEGVSLALLRSMPSFFYPEFRAATPISPRLVLHVRSFKPDIIHFQTTFLVGAGGLLLGKMIKKPIVGTFHTNFMHEEYLSVLRIHYQKEIISAILWKYALLFFNQCDAILAPSVETSKELKKQGVKRPVYVIPNSIDENKIVKVGQAELELLRMRHKLQKHVLLYVGRVSAEKSLDILIKSFATVLKTSQDVTLLIVGHGPKMKNLILLTKELKITKRVVFTGQIIPEKLLTLGYYQLADAFVTASSSEVLPISVIEAMYFGLPIVGVAKRGVAEMVRGVGLLSPVGDTKKLAANMSRIISDDILRQKLSKNSLTVYERKYKVGKIMKQYERFYLDVIKNYERKKFERDVNLSSIFLDE